MKIRALYLCYFGLREQLVQTQVLPYLRQLRAGGVEVSLLTFEADPKATWTAEAERDWRQRLASESIRWRWLTYHKRPSLPATVYDILVGAWTAIRIARRERINVFHGRAHVASAMGALAKRASGGRLVFDVRGFNAEEYVDAGRWKAGGLKYRLTKCAERAVLKTADGFVVLTERAKEILFPGCGTEDPMGRPVEVIPCCVDLDRFEPDDPGARDRVRAELGVGGRRVIVYVGALGGWYLTEEMAEFLAVAHREDPGTFSLILTQSPAELIAGPLRGHGVGTGHYKIVQVPPREVPRYLAAADVAISFVKPCYSKISSSPTKVAEYLASGLPIVCTSGVGDLDDLVEGERVGVLVQEFHPAAYTEALLSVESLRREGGFAERCRATARRRFDLKGIGGVRYRRLYDRLFDRSRGLVPAGAD